MSTTGKPIRCRAAVLWDSRKPLVIEDVLVAPPRAGEVRVRMVAASICHTDFVPFKGYEVKNFFEGTFPVVLGHEGVGVVESVGPGVTTMQPGDHVVPMFGRKCNACVLCNSGKTNLCVENSAMGLGTMKDGTTRVAVNGQAAYQFFGLGTFAEYAVFGENCTAKVNRSVPLKHLAPIGCCIPTGMGSALNAASVQPGSTCAVWGLGGVGLAAVLGCRLAGATTILGLDVNPAKEAVAKKFGCTEFINPTTLSKPVAQYMAERFNGGLDFSFDASGSVDAMRDAFESVRSAGGLCVVIGGAPPDQRLCINPTDLLCEKRITGCLFGGYHFRNDLPQLVEQVASGKIPVDDFVTHDFPFNKIHEALDLMKAGNSIRVALHFD